MTRGCQVFRNRHPLPAVAPLLIATGSRPSFLDVPGLVQKFYGRDESTGAYCGIYFFESQEALAAYRQSELARTIPAAYEAVEVRPELYDVLYSLRPAKGPLSE